MLVGRYVLELEVEEEDGGDPPVDGGIGLDVRVAEHTFDVAGIDFDDKFADADKVETGSTEGAEEAVEF